MSQQQPCLPVSKKRRKFDSKAPVSFEAVDSMDASEYLRRVVHQASNLPETFSSTTSKPTATTTTMRSRDNNHVPIDGLGASLSYLVSDRTLIRPPPSQEYLPKNPELWVDRTLETFSRLRDYLERCSQNGVGGKDTNRLPVPAMRDRPAWHIFCVGVDDARGNEGSYFQDEAEPKEEESADKQEPAWKKNLPEHGYNPDISLLLQLDQVMVRKVLGNLAHYVRTGWSPSNAQRSAWVYALLARLERPIHRDDASVLYGLLKTLCQVRSEIEIRKDDGGDRTNNNTRNTQLARINVLIAIIGVYFEQGGGFSGVMTVK